ncbi:MAG: methyl-accepting chemotaxis protein, partial [Spirochaetaceae bacterium]|nr:methyl-accepting chemotaxis protein [Spirochaetaceae bacterium]
MKSLRTRFFLFFTGLGMLTALVAGIAMYIQYMGYIKSNYRNTLSQVLIMLEKQYPALSNPDALIKLGKEGADEYWNMVYTMNTTAQTFGFTYIYFVRPVGDSFQFVFSSEQNPKDYTLDEIFMTYSLDAIPEDMQEAYNEKKLHIDAKPVHDESGVFVSGFIPVFNGGVCVGMIGADYSISFVNALEGRALISFLIALCVSIAGAAFFAFHVSTSLITPIKEVKKTAASLAALKFDVEIQRDRQDEIGDMQQALVTIRDSLRNYKNELDIRITRIMENSAKLNKTIAESSKALGIINGDMDAMQSETDMQIRSAAETSDAVDKIAGSIKGLDAAVQIQSEHITESSAAVEEMVASINAIRSAALAVGKTTDTLSTSSAAGHTMLKNLTGAIKRIQDESASLRDANKSVSDIAARTNILAMNAAIEAAHAGESGRGFAVVAGEIRKLAELSAKESNSISEEIKKIEQVIEEISVVSGKTVDTMGTIFTEIKSMDDSFLQMSHAVEEQATGGTQILTALKTILDMTGQVQDSSKAIHTQSESIHGEMKALRCKSEKVGALVKEVKSASGNIAAFLEHTKTF